MKKECVYGNNNISSSRISNSIDHWNTGRTPVSPNLSSYRTVPYSNFGDQFLKDYSTEIKSEIIFL